MYQYNPLLLQEGPLGNFMDQTADFARRNGTKLSHAELQQGRNQAAKVLRSAHSQDPLLARFVRDAMVEKGQRRLNNAKVITGAIKNKARATKPIKLSQIGKKFTGVSDLAKGVKTVARRAVLKH